MIKGMCSRYVTNFISYFSVKSWQIDSIIYIPPLLNRKYTFKNSQVHIKNLKDKSV